MEPSRAQNKQAERSGDLLERVRDIIVSGCRACAPQTDAQMPEAAKDCLTELLKRQALEIMTPIINYLSHSPARVAAAPSTMTTQASTAVKIISEVMDELLANGLPPTVFAEQTFSQFTQRVFQLTANTATYNTHDLVNQALTHALEQGTIHELFQQELNLNNLLYLGGNVALKTVPNKTGASRVIIREDFREALEGKGLSGTNFIRSTTWYSAQIPFTDYMEALDDIERAANLGLIRFRDLVVLDANQMNEQFGENMHQSLQNKKVGFVPVSYGSAYLGFMALLFSASDMTEPLDGAARMKLAFIADGLAKGLAHIKRVEAATPEVGN